jgi:hypothetical protein
MVVEMLLVFHLVALTLMVMAVDMLEMAAALVATPLTTKVAAVQGVI